MKNLFKFGGIKMAKQENELDEIASVVGSVKVDQISSGRSQIHVSIGNFVDRDETEIDEGNLSPAEVDKLLGEIYEVISSPTRSNMAPEQREDLHYILEGLQAQLTRGQQSNKQILRRFLTFLDDRVPEVSRLVSKALTG
jgi:hypothetical protein